MTNSESNCSYGKKTLYKKVKDLLNESLTGEDVTFETEDFTSKFKLQHELINLNHEYRKFLLLGDDVNLLILGQKMAKLMDEVLDSCLYCLDVDINKLVVQLVNNSLRASLVFFNTPESDESQLENAKNDFFEKFEFDAKTALVLLGSSEKLIQNDREIYANIFLIFKLHFTEDLFNVEILSYCFLMLKNQDALDEFINFTSSLNEDTVNISAINQWLMNVKTPLRSK